jgi:biopolymer transport protein ExbB
MGELISAGSTLAAISEAFERTWQVFAVGGAYMVVIFICSLVAVAVMVFKALTLRRERIVPESLARQVDQFGTGAARDERSWLEREVRSGQTSLARLCAVALRHVNRNQNEIRGAVQSSAREEVVKMHTGLATLEVVITIAPLLGLLGTASGLVLVFRDLGPAADHVQIARGISRALYTTIAGLAVAVPSVIAHSYFSRKIETMAARMEVLLGRVVGTCQADRVERDDVGGMEGASERRGTESIAARSSSLEE